MEQAKTPSACITSFLFLLHPQPPQPTLFPYTTLFRSTRVLEHGRDAARVGPRDRLAVDQNAPAVRVNEAPEHSEERGLAAAGRADHRAELALAHCERDVVERLDRPGAGRITLGDVLERDEPGGCLHTSWRIARAMTSLWISDVPSPISVSFASRKIRSTGNSVM